MTRIPELEAWLDEAGLAWELRDVVVGRIDQLAGLTNQARLEPLDEDTVQRYAADMAEGAEFPPIVLNAEGLVPVGGNHRVAGARRAGRPTLPAYVVEGLSPHLEWLLALEDNRRHGLPLSEAERVHHAVRLTNAGESIAAAARLCGISPQKLQHHLDELHRMRRADERAARSGLSGPDWEALAPSTRVRLAAITSAKVFAKAAALTAAGSITASEVGSLVGKLNGAESTADAMELLIKLDQSGRTARGRGRPPTVGRAPRARLMGELDVLLRYDPAAVAHDDSAADLRVLNQIQSTVDHLTRISAAIAAVQAEGAA